MSGNRSVLKVVLIIANVVLLAGLGFSSVYFFLKYNDLKNKSLTSDQRISKYEKDISKTYALPVGDKATLYDVTQADSLKKEGPNKDFFKDANNGDILLLYEKAKIGVLYRPSTKKIIKVGPAAITQNISLALYGAKADRDSAKGVIAKAFTSGVSLASEGDAKTALTGTVVVDISGSNSETAAKIAQELKGTVGTVPEGEDKPASSVGIAIYIAPAAPAP